jgi:hypothetical protein
MWLSRLCVLAVLLFTGGSVATGQDSIRLRFEIYRNNSVIRNPEVSVTSGSTGRIDINGVEAIAFTPTLRKSDEVAIAFDVGSGSRHLTLSSSFDTATEGQRRGRLALVRSPSV